MIKRKDNTITGWEFRDIEAGYEIFNCGQSIYKILDLDVDNRGHLGIREVLITIVERSSGKLYLMKSSDEVMNFFDDKVPEDVYDEIIGRMIPKKLEGR